MSESTAIAIAGSLQTIEKILERIAKALEIRVGIRRLEASDVQ